MKKSLVSLSLALMCVLAWAIPSLQQVETAVQQGHYTEAESMLREVVDAKPGSAKAHYIYAEVLAHNAKFAQAAEQAQMARQADPAIKFTQPEKFRSFEQLLERELYPAPRTQNSTLAMPAAAVAQPRPAEPAGIPSWVWGAGLALAGVMLWRGFSRSRAMAAPNPSMGMAAPGAYGAAPGMGVPYGMPTASPSSGLLGTGLAVAGGVAAGMLVDQMLHSNHGSGMNMNQQSGLQPGMFDAPQFDDAANQLENRDVDFGNGGDWDGGGSVDLGGSDGGGDWG